VPSADVDHAGRYPARLRADRYGDHPCRLGDQQQRVRASRPCRRAELAAHQQHQSRPDALAGENAEDVRHRIRPAASSGPSAQQAKTTGTRLKQLRPIADARQKMAGAQRLRPQWPGKAGGGDLADHGDVHAGRAQSRDAAADSRNPRRPSGAADSQVMTTAATVRPVNVPGSGGMVGAAPGMCVSRCRPRAAACVLAMVTRCCRCG
jgi:hypothetical protein